MTLFELCGCLGSVGGVVAAVALCFIFSQNLALHEQIGLSIFGLLGGWCLGIAITHLVILAQGSDK